MNKFPSINQFRNVVAHVRRQAAYTGIDAAGEPIFNPAPVYPKMRFDGTVKLHSTNGAVVFNPDDTIHFQSRERVLTHESDNAGFHAHMSNHTAALLNLRDNIRFIANTPDQEKPVISVFGEWCGGNIQKGVAIAGLPKMFVIFAIQVGGDWLPSFLSVSNEEASILSIQHFPTYSVTVDFEHPESAQNELAAITEAVEACCPVGKALGVEGIGEGVVWKSLDMPSPDYWFKVKGEKHSASKVKTLAAVDVEAVEGMRAFVALAVTEARLQQGLQNLLNEQLKPLDMTSIGDFIRWVHADVVKEEADTFAATGLKERNLGGAIAQVAKRWYSQKLNELATA